MWLFSPRNRKSLVGEATFLSMPGSGLGPIIVFEQRNPGSRGFMLSYTQTCEQKGPRLKLQCDLPIVPAGTGPPVVVVVVVQNKLTSGSPGTDDWLLLGK